MKRRTSTRVAVGATSIALLLATSAQASATEGPSPEPTSELVEVHELGKFDRSTEAAFDDMVASGLDALSDAELSLISDALEPGQAVLVPHDEVAPEGALAARAIRPNIGGTTCEAQASNVHRRASGNYGTVGSKPTTRCTSSQRQLSITTVLMKQRSVWGTGSSQVASWSNGNFGQAAYQPKNREVTCTNKKDTTWHTVNQHVVVRWDNCVYSLVTKSPKTKLSCGT